MLRSIKTTLAAATLVLGLAPASIVGSAVADDQDGIVTVKSRYSVGETVSRIKRDVANKGIMAPDDALVIADEPIPFAAAVVRLLKAPADAEQLASTARKYVLANWTWEKHWLDLEREFYSALDGNSVVDWEAPAVVDERH